MYEPYMVEYNPRSPVGHWPRQHGVEGSGPGAQAHVEEGFGEDAVSQVPASPACIPAAMMHFDFWENTVLLIRWTGEYGTPCTHVIGAYDMSAIYYNHGRGKAYLEVIQWIVRRGKVPNSVVPGDSPVSGCQADLRNPVIVASYNLLNRIIGLDPDNVGNEGYSYDPKDLAAYCDHLKGYVYKISILI